MYISLSMVSHKIILRFFSPDFQTMQLKLYIHLAYTYAVCVTFYRVGLLLLADFEHNIPYLIIIIIIIIIIMIITTMTINKFRCYYSEVITLGKSKQ